MATDTTIEGRLEAVEEAIAEIKGWFDSRPIHPNWLADVTGIFEDEPAFDEVIRLGREFRMADRPEEDNSP